MKQTLKTFITSQDGAVTVDMTILMALAIGLALAVTPLVISGVQDVTLRTTDVISVQNSSPKF